MTYVDLLRKVLLQGVPVENALDFLRDAGASPLEAAVAVHIVTGTELADARKLVEISQAWKAPRPRPAPTVAAEPSVGHYGRSGRGSHSVLAHLLAVQSARPSAQPQGG
ncbi:hypothetical protein [Ramlibacter tataouinensis]|uniref:Uncharacterized protein n=1 Tax=Ramlibacter tataouinensis (strain ATCC BAA-407 / DSM 14655 / LMG 21543 / TTB310) TaxID=365046 RepID=F5XW88_RAMTT|nr:hypothetical protein [Ramlibacter tataouinensis]AEG91658.1 hypothetical protein Rta_05800 [Ramlibacter tataouinensis TTB310]